MLGSSICLQLQAPQNGQHPALDFPYVTDGSPALGSAPSLAAALVDAIECP